MVGVNGAFTGEFTGLGVDGGDGAVRIRGLLGVGLGEGVGEEVGEGVGVGVGVGEGVGVGVGEGVGVGVGEGVGVGVGEGVGVGVGEGMMMGEGIGEGFGEGIGDRAGVDGGGGDGGGGGGGDGGGGEGGGGEAANVQYSYGTRPLGPRKKPSGLRHDGATKHHEPFFLRDTMVPPVSSCASEGSVAAPAPVRPLLGLAKAAVHAETQGQSPFAGGGGGFGGGGEGGGEEVTTGVAQYM